MNTNNKRKTQDVIEKNVEGENNTIVTKTQKEKKERKEKKVKLNDDEDQKSNKNVKVEFVEENGITMEWIKQKALELHNPSLAQSDFTVYHFYGNGKITHQKGQDLYLGRTEFITKVPIVRKEHAIDFSLCKKAEYNPRRKKTPYVIVAEDHAYYLRNCMKKARGIGIDAEVSLNAKEYDIICAGSSITIQCLEDFVQKKNNSIK